MTKRWWKFCAAGSVGWLAATAPSTGDGSEAAQPARIHEVQSGERTVARASWWGFDPLDATATLQAAIDSGARKVVVDHMSSPWVVRPIRLRSNLTLEFERGVTMQAKRGEFQGSHDALFTAWDAHDLQLIGHGATLRMWRQDYARPPYKKAEWRHVLSLRGCTNVLVSGLTLTESGGDGIYLGAGHGGAPNVGVRIVDVVCDRNYRQGISVITAQDLLIERCRLSNTAGTPPSAGIDFEPNHPRERLMNCTMRECVAENNAGPAYDFYFGQLNATSTPVSIRLVNCISRGTNRVSVKLSMRPKQPDDAVRGLIEFVNCQFTDTGTAGIELRSKLATACLVRLDRCVVADASATPRLPAPIVLRSGPADPAPLGGVVVADCRIRALHNRPPMLLEDWSGQGWQEITGRLLIADDGHSERVKITPERLREWSPGASSRPAPPLQWTPKLIPLNAGECAKAIATAAPRLRGKAEWLLYARQGETVQLELRSQRVGRYAPQPVQCTLHDMDGKTLARQTVPFDQVQHWRWQAPATGVYLVEADAGPHTASVVSTSHPIWLTGRTSALHFVRGQGRYYFYVPPNTRRFAVGVYGEGAGEAVTAKLLSPDGTVCWHASNVTRPQVCLVPDQVPLKPGVWAIELSPPEQGYFEDHYLELRGLPNVLALHPAAVLRAAADAQ